MRYCALGVSEGWQMRQRATDVPQLPCLRSYPAHSIPAVSTPWGACFCHACVHAQAQYATFAASTIGLQYPVISV